jgi:hypothetical protein
LLYTLTSLNFTILKIYHSFHLDKIANFKTNIALLKIFWSLPGTKKPKKSHCSKIRNILLDSNNTKKLTASDKNLDIFGPNRPCIRSEMKEEHHQQGNDAAHAEINAENSQVLSNCPKNQLTIAPDCPLCRPDRRSM